MWSRFCCRLLTHCQFLHPSCDICCSPARTVSAKERGFLDEIIIDDKASCVVKLLEFEGTDRLHYENMYYWPNLYKGSFLSDEGTNEFVVVIYEAGVYKYVF